VVVVALAWIERDKIVHHRGVGSAAAAGEGAVAVEEHHARIHHQQRGFAQQPLVSHRNEARPGKNREQKQSSREREPAAATVAQPEVHGNDGREGQRTRPRQHAQRDRHPCCGGSRQVVAQRAVDQGDQQEDH
jgi:hypothetical protein